ncbi:MAG: hypothetical protein JWR36_2822 [Glaciihabitans sp.]|nr:hypothetical protein [Glaciihabitans sp.]
MTDADDSYAPYAGLVVFPRSPADLTATATCPACFTRLRSTICIRCGLDLSHPAAIELAASSVDAAHLLDRRLELIGRIRYDSAQDAKRAMTAAPAMAQPAAAAISFPASTAPASTAPASSGPASTTPPNALPTSTLPAWRPPASTATTPQRVPRRSSVQVIVLIVGVALLSIAAIFFLVYAFIAYGILVRSAIIAAITVTAFVVASVLKRRKLRTTAEGIAVFAAVLVYLDAYAVRANNLFDAQSSNVQLYWGLTLVISSVVLLAWNRLSRLRVPSIVGFAVLAPGVGFVAGGLGHALDGTTRAYLIAIVIAAAGLANPLAPRWARTASGSSKARAERILMLITSAVAILVAFSLAFVIERQVDAASTWALLAVAGVAFAHVVVGSRALASPTTTVLIAIIAGIGAGALALTGAALPLRVGDGLSLLIWPPLVAGTVAILIEALLRRAGSPYWLAIARLAAMCAVVIAALSIVPPLYVVLANVASAARGVANPWHAKPFDLVGDRGATVLLSVEVLAILAVVAAVVWLSVRLQRTRLLVWIIAVLIVAAVPLLKVSLVVVCVWLFLGLASLAASIVVRRRGGSNRAIRAALIGLVVMGTVLGYFASWASIGTWAYGSAAALVVVLGARYTFAATRVVARAALLIPALAVLVIGAAALSRQLGGNQPTGTLPARDGLQVVAVVAAVLVVVAFAVPWGSRVDRRVLFWVSLPVALGAAGIARLLSAWLAGVHSDNALLDGNPMSLVVAIVLVAALAVALLARRYLPLAAERITAAASVAPAVLLLVDAVLRLAHVPSFVLSIEPFACTLLVAAAILTLTIVPVIRERANAVPRWAGEIGIAIVGVPSTIAVLLMHPTSTWLALVLLGVTFLVLAISSDGLFASRSARRHLGWIALLFATVGLWWRLGSDRVAPIEPYVLPLAGALLLVALLIDRAARTRVPQGRAAPLVALGGLAVGILPLALASSSGTVVRPIAVGLVSTALLAVGAYARPRSAADRDYLTGAAFVGAIGVLVVGVGRALADRSIDGIESAHSDAWLALAFAVIVAGAFGFARPLRTGLDSQNTARSIAAQATVIVALVAVLLLEGGSVGSEPYGRARALGVVLLFSAIHVIALRIRRSPLTRLVGWMAIAFGAIFAVIGLNSLAFKPIETGTVPIALALLASGAIHLADTPAARSWRQLGPGLLVLLLPSLLATAADRPIWRLVALGVVAVAAIVIGVVRRLQAPFILGVVVALIHGIGTFAVQIRTAYESVPWWLWLGIGGILLILLAARYEKRIQNLRSVAMRVGSLR